MFIILTAGTKFVQNKTLLVLKTSPLEMLGGGPEAKAHSHLLTTDLYRTVGSFRRRKLLFLHKGRECVVFLRNKDEMGWECNQRKEEGEAGGGGDSRMKDCLRLDGTSEEHRGSQRHFTNTENTKNREPKLQEPLNIYSEKGF